MATRANRQGNAVFAADANVQAGVQVPQQSFAAEAVAPEAIAPAPFNWGTVMEEVNATKTREDIIRECLADAEHFRRFNNLHVSNVVATTYAAKDTGTVVTRLTFVIKERIPGMIQDNNTLDAFGQPVKRIGPSTNVFTSTYAVSGAMKDTARGAIFAGEVADMQAVLAGASERLIVGSENIANTLYAGGVIDVICQYVPANTEYVNPFSAGNDNNVPKVFDIDRIFHHVVRLEFGEVGVDTYMARIRG